MRLSGLAWSWEEDNPLEVSYDNVNVTYDILDTWFHEQRITEYEFTVSSQFGVRVRFTNTNDAIMFKLTWGDRAWRNRLTTGA